MIKKVLFKETNKAYLITATIGTIIGLTLLLLTTDIYYTFITYITTGNDANRNYTIIHKPVSVFNSFNKKSPTFSSKEIKGLLNQNFIDTVIPFTNNRFKVAAIVDKKSLPEKMYTELFFEAVPDKYLDFNANKWDWKDGDSYVPIALPQHYLTLYNFGFAQSWGMPQFSANTIQAVDFKLHLRGNGQSKVFKSSIVGFTKRMNTILVPQSFLTWANKNFSVNNSTAPSRLLIITDDPSNPALYEYFQKHSYKTDEAHYDNNRISFILKMTLSAIGFIALLIIILALFIFLLSFQQLLIKSQESLRNLQLIGYSQKVIMKHYNIFFISILAVINSVSYLTKESILFISDGYLDKMGVPLQSSPLAFLILLILSAILFVVNSLLIKKYLKECL